MTTLILLVASVAVVFRSANSYTIVTDSGFEVVPFFSLQKFSYRYGDVARVQIECSRTSYEVEFADGQSAELWLDAPMPGSILSIERIDSHLRSIGPKFVVIVDKRRVLAARQCIAALAQQYGHADTLARIMHVK